MNYVLMGIDRIGKSSFIEENLNDKEIIHLTKPPADIDQLMYSKAEYCNYFLNLKKSDNIVYDRGHIDEFVYAPMYRNYSTYYLNIMEQEFADELLNTVFILLYADNFDMIQDDGLSLDFNKKEEEQQLFIKYFDTSLMKHKIKIKVNDGRNYRSRHDIKHDFIHQLSMIE